MWAKVMVDHRIKNQCVYELDEKMDYSRMHFYLSEIAAMLDIPTPMLIKVQIFNYAKFNHVKFVKSDFVESIDFDYLMIENIATK